GARGLGAGTESRGGLTVGVGLCRQREDAESLFGIAQMGHLSPPMLLGALTTIEAGLVALDIPHASGGAGAAAQVVAATGAAPPKPTFTTNTVDNMLETP